MNPSKITMALTSVLSIPACMLVASLGGVSFMETTGEIGDQTRWFVYTAVAMLAVAVPVGISNIRRIGVGIVDLAVSCFVIWWGLCYCINDCMVVTRLYNIVFLVPVYVALRIFLSVYRSAAQWIFFVLCVCGIAESVVGILQALGISTSGHSLFSVTGTFFNPGPYGGYIATILILALGYAISRQTFVSKYFSRFSTITEIPVRGILWGGLFGTAVTTTVITAIILPSTMSRAAFVAVIVSILSMVISNRKVRRSLYPLVKAHKLQTWMIGIAVIIVVSVGTYGIYAWKKDSADGRLLQWKMLVQIISNHPYYGVGPGYWHRAFGDKQANYFQRADRPVKEINVAGSPEYGMNEYLRIGAETGVVGLALFIFLIVAACRQLMKHARYYAFAFVALVVFAIFSYPFSMLPTQVVFVIFLAVAGRSTGRRHVTTKSDPAILMLALAGSVAIAGGLAKPYLTRIAATARWQQIHKQYQLNIYSDVVKEAPKLYPLLSDNPDFLFEYGRSLCMEKQYKKSIAVLSAATRFSGDPMYYNVIGNNYKALKEYDRAARAYLQAHYLIPHRMYPLYLLAQLYVEAGDMVKAGSYARRVVDMAPKIESIFTRDMQREMMKLIGSTVEHEE